MDPRLLSPLLALALLLPGCVGTAAASAVDAMSTADAAAKAWDDDARLAQALAYEGSFPVALLLQYAEFGTGSREDFERARNDENVGDGLAEVWAYRYVALGKESAYLVVVDRDDNILRESETPLRDNDASLGDWTLDSDDAVEIALGKNEHIGQGTKLDDFAVFAVLHREEGVTEWLVAGGGVNADGIVGGYVRIDAATGDVLASDGGAFTGFGGF